jgi:flavodoxin
MNDILIVYYSMGGHTRRLAEELGEAIGGDVEEIVEVRPRAGLPGMLRAVVDATLHRMPAVLAPRRDVAAYRLLVLGGPIWASRLAAPVRTFAQAHGRRAQRIAFFCTEGGRGGEQAFADLARLCGREPVATLVVDEKHLDPAAHRGDLGRFSAHLARERTAGVPGAIGAAPA